MFKKLLILLVCATSQCLWSWFEAGHMVAAQIAYERLAPQTKEWVDGLIQQCSSFDRHGEDFVSASCWADDLALEGFRLFGPWHYSNWPYDPDKVLSPWKKKTLERQNAQSNILWALEQCREVLLDPNAGEWEKAFALRFYIHLLVDLHQPLHTACLYNKDFPDGDRGGNLFRLQGSVCNLHLLWDGGMGWFQDRVPHQPLDDEGRLRIIQMAGDFNQRLTIALPQFYSFEAIAEESRRLAIDYAYEGISPGQAPTFAYIERARPIIERQIVSAGYRLAETLNIIFNSLNKPTS